MADVKESALTQRSDCKWVRALDANGNSIRISKEDLASVVGGLLGNPLAFKRVLTSKDNMDNIEDGIYSSIDANDPDNNYSTNTMYIQLTTPSRTNDIWQFALSANALGIAVRKKRITGWSVWKSIINID